MPSANYLPEVLETTEAERLATEFIFTEGPTWHPDGYWYFVDLRQNKLLRLTPGKAPELVRTTIGGNGTTFDLQGRLVVCEGDDRRLTRMTADGTAASTSPIRTSAGRIESAKFRAPRVTIIFGMAHASIVWLPDGGLSVLAHCEYPNGLALSPDERIMYVANTRSSQYIQATKLDAAGNMVGRSIFADLNEGSEPGTPDGSKVDSVGRVYCDGPGSLDSFRGGIS